MTVVDTPSRAAATPALRRDCTGVVLCGGRSLRMGRDKARIELGGRTLIERAVAALDVVCGEVLLASGDEPRFADLGRREIRDAAPDSGPLAGLVAALDAARTPWVIALACDMPAVDPRVLARLAELAAEHGSDVTLLGSSAGVEPLCAVYRTSCASAARAALVGGRAKLTDFHDGAGVRAALSVQVAALERFPAELRACAADAARNVNTPEDLAQALRAAVPGARRP